MKSISNKVKNTVEFKKKLAFLFLSSILLLSGCSSSSNNDNNASIDDNSSSIPEPQEVATSISGIAVDGYISGATVCLDINENNLCDSNETSTTTSTDGSYSLDVNATEGVKSIIMVGGTNTATGEAFSGILKEIVEIDDATETISANITPLTTVAANIYKAQNKLDSDYTIIMAKDTLSTNLGLTKEELVSDPLTDEKVFEKTQQIAQVTNILQKTIQSDESDSAKNINAYDHVMIEIASTLNTSDVDTSKIVSQLESSSYAGSTVSIEEDVEVFVSGIVDEIPTNVSDITDTKYLANLENDYKTFINEAKEKIETNSTDTLSSTLSSLQDMEVTNNTPASISGTPTTSIAENSLYSFTPTATDINGDTLTYSISSKPSWATFNENTGNLSGRPGYTDAGMYTGIIISVNDGTDNSLLASFSITVTDTNQIPTATYSSFSLDENATYSGTLTGSDNDGDTLTYTKVTDTSHGVVTVSSSGSFTYAPTLEYFGTDSFTYKVNDTQDDSSIKTVSITVNRLSPIPQFAPLITSTDVTVDEGQTAALTITATDENDDTLTYSLTGSDVSSFNVNSSTGVVTFKEAPDYETRTTYILTLNVSDGLYISTKTINIVLSNINDAPVITSNNSFTVNENQSSAFTVIATDNEGDSLTYSLTGTDASSFNINSSTGIVTFKTAPDYETKTSYIVTVNASDGTATTTQTVTITIANTNDAPTITSANSFSVNENQSSAFTITSSDIDGDSITYSLTGTDAGYFNVNSSGVVTFKQTPNYEAKSSYSIVANASDSLNTTTQDVTVTIINQNDNDPVINVSSTVTANENQTSALDINATDVDNDTLTYSLTGQDATSFSVSTDGIVTFKVAPDYETKTSYDITVNVNDGIYTATKNILLNINDRSEIKPVLQNLATSIIENTAIGTKIGEVNCTNIGSIDSNITSFTLSDTTDFNITTDGNISNKTVLDFETKTSYSLTAYATNDAGNSNSVTITIDVNNTGDFYIRAATFDNAKTSSVTDDKLYIYFSQEINASSIDANLSDNYDENGSVVPVLDNNLSAANNNSFFHQHLITFTAGSTLFNLQSDTNLSFTPNQIQDVYGAYPDDHNETLVKPFRVILETGQLTTYSSTDDVYYKSGKTRVYSEYNTSVVDNNTTGLMWQREDDNTTRTLTDSTTYCANLSLAGYSDWRLPTVNELVQLTDKQRTYPAINALFIDTDSSFYWSSTTNAHDSNYAWSVRFDSGRDSYQVKDDICYTRCVRDIN